MAAASDDDRPMSEYENAFSSAIECLAETLAEIGAGENLAARLDERISWFEEDGKRNAVAVLSFLRERVKAGGVKA